jgi:hypothetical protein
MKGSDGRPAFCVTAFGCDIVVTAGVVIAMHELVKC